MNTCQCEHRKHFGGQGHTYGVQFRAEHITPVETPVGTFNVCPACKQTCYKEYVDQTQTAPRAGRRRRGARS